MIAFSTRLIFDTIAPPKPTAQKYDRTPETNSPEVRSHPRNQQPRSAIAQSFRL
ncbi:hypothetical protein [Arthrospira sp. PCC 8006]|uniref:hypothetical protein n=1 Tax=Oscillatoriales TaxID=1150 RepID=UPI00396F2A05